MVQLELPSGTLPAQRTLLFSRTEKRKRKYSRKKQKRRRKRIKGKEKRKSLLIWLRRKLERPSRRVKKQWRPPKKGASNTRKPAKNAEKHARKLLNEILSVEVAQPNVGEARPSVRVQEPRHRYRDVFFSS